MSHPNPNHYLDKSNKTVSVWNPAVSRYSWMVTANNMADHPIRSCGDIIPYHLVDSAAEQNKRTNALSLHRVHTNHTPFRHYFPAANVPADLPTKDIRDLGHAWFESTCQLAEKTQSNIQQAHQHITEAVRLRTGDPRAVMVAKDFLAARELAIKAEGYAEGLRAGRRLLKDWD